MKLSQQAKQILEELKSSETSTVEEFEKEGYDQAMVNRAALELEEAGLVKVEEEEEEQKVLTDAGEEVLENGSPEFQLVKELQEGPKEMSDLEGLDLDVALGKARQKNWVEIREGKVSLTEKGKKQEEDPIQERLERGDYRREDEERNLVETRTSTQRLLQITEKGEEVELDDIEEDFNVEARTKTPRTGKKHFYKQVMDYAQQKWLEMGFEEMQGDYVVSSFLCFDALYIAQDHPSRDLQDTFFLEKPEKADLSEYIKQVEDVEATHENGWETGSTGWGYDWSKEDSERNVLRTHTTATSSKKLLELEEEDLPAKFFIISRAFRNETVDRTHLADFDQAEGIVVGKDVNFSNLKGYLSEFFEKMGYDEFRLIPTYYPYTEMSVEIQVWDEEDEEWLGMGGAGLFRPEVVKPLLGFEATVLAWGIGIGRIGMQAAGITDIRDLYSNDLKIVEDTPIWRPDS